MNTMARDMRSEPDAEGVLLEELLVMLREAGDRRSFIEAGWVVTGVLNHLAKDREEFEDLAAMWQRLSDLAETGG